VNLPSAGAFVLSLDFELHWGVRVRQRPDGPYRGHLLGEREVVARLLDLFEEFEIAATWATVGALFARSREELLQFWPVERPAYLDPRLAADREPLGEGEDDDPLHFAGSLVERIRRTPRQELATHTFSHYYCNEAGQTERTFAADIDAALEIAATRGVRLRSIVFPRNQHRPQYDRVLLERGIFSYRGNPCSWLWRFGTTEEAVALPKRLGRLLDGVFDLTGSNGTRWCDVVQASGLSDVRASTILRAWSPRRSAYHRLHVRRVVHALQRAARERTIFHLWWHPHNMGGHVSENLTRLRRILEAFRVCRDRDGMLSVSMADVHFLANGGA
jgi:peptidoglycan/xylan/chitin deacetylase (PgdA/CDA1 family)